MKKYIKKRLVESLKYNNFILKESEGSNFGYHAGDLKNKSGSLSDNNFMSTLVSQLGTGHFFFGDLENAINLKGSKKNATNMSSALSETKIYKADFSKYNMFRPTNASDYYDNFIMPMIKALNQLNPSNLEESEIYDGLIELAEIYREFGININNDDFMSILKQYLNDMYTKTSNNDDVLNTRVLKHVGYEGVDLRWTDKDGFNDGRANVGSVIFDLKPGTVSEVNIN